MKVKAVRPWPFWIIHLLLVVLSWFDSVDATREKLTKDNGNRIYGLGSKRQHRCVFHYEDPAEVLDGGLQTAGPGQKWLLLPITTRFGRDTACLRASVVQLSVFCICIIIFTCICLFFDFIFVIYHSHCFILGIDSNYLSARF